MTTSSLNPEQPRCGPLSPRESASGAECGDREGRGAQNASEGPSRASGDSGPPVWVDGNPLMEAIAAAVWDHCHTEGASLIVDDPRNIAAVAAAELAAVRDTRVEELTARIAELEQEVADADAEADHNDRTCEAGQRAETAERRLDLAHQARRAKEHQLDGIRRALCDTGAMHDDDPYSHADLEDVIRQAAAGGDDAEAAIARVRGLATTARVATWQACTCDERPACGCPTRPVAWKLNPADILAALDQPQEAP